MTVTEWVEDVNFGVSPRTPRKNHVELLYLDVYIYICESMTVTEWVEDVKIGVSPRTPHKNHVFNCHVYKPWMLLFQTLSM